MNIENTQICDDVLLERMKSHDDQAAFSILMARYTDRVRGLAFKLLHKRELAEDALQDVFAVVWEKRKNWVIGGPAKFSTWVYRVTFNKCVDVKRKQRIEVDIQDVPLETPSKAEGRIDHKALKGKIQELLQTLPKQQALALQLYYYEEMNVEDIAFRLENTPVGVRSLIKRGKASLRGHQGALEMHKDF